MGAQFGWIAAVVSCIAFGSFGVPIKGEASRSVDIDPLVFQSYKTIMCFITSWLVLLLGQEFTFTPWGIVSGLFWVPAGVAAVIAVKNSGLAVSQGTWSSLIVIVSFIWGLFIFHEEVHSKTITLLAVFLMVFGLWGMSYFSSSQKQQNENYRTLNQRQFSGIQLKDDDSALGSSFGDSSDSIEDSHAMQINIPGEPSSVSVELSAPVECTNETEYVSVCNFQVSRRKMGLTAAFFNGIWGGSVLVPMNCSGSKTNGLGFAISFSVGAAIITVFLWLIRLCFNAVKMRSFSTAYNSLPSFHFRVMAIPGSISGCLWSIGNIASMISVQYLGEAIGYSVVQASMLISGLWGIFWYKEVSHFRMIVLWFCSAGITVLGMTLLGLEHK